MTREETLSIFSKGLAAFMSRNHLTLSAVGDLLGCKQANIAKMRAGKGFPSMEGFFTLLEHGMTLEEAFGPELAAKIVLPGQKSSIPESPLEKAKFVRAGLKELLAQLTELDARLPDVPEDR